MTRLLLAPLLAAVLLAAGCGGSDNEEKNQYISEVNQAQNDLARRLKSVQGPNSATSTAAQDKATLTAYEQAVAAGVTRLKAIKPPESVAKLHKDLVTLVVDYGGDLRKARALVGSDDPKAALEAQQQLNTAGSEFSTKLNTITQAINRELRE